MSEAAGIIIALAGLSMTLLGALVAFAVAAGRLVAKVEAHDKKLDRHDSYIVQLRGETGEQRGRLDSIHGEE